MRRSAVLALSLGFAVLPLVALSFPAGAAAPAASPSPPPPPPTPPISRGRPPGAEGAGGAEELAQARTAYERAKAAAEEADELRARKVPEEKLPPVASLFAEAADAFARAAEDGAAIEPLDLYRWAVAADEARRSAEALDLLARACFLLDRVERPEGPEWLERRAGVHLRLSRLYEARGYRTAAGCHARSAARLGAPEAAEWAERLREALRRGQADDPQPIPVSPAAAADLLLYSRDERAAGGLLGREVSAAPPAAGGPVPASSPAPAAPAPGGTAADASLRAHYAEGILRLLAADPAARAGTVFEDDPVLARLRLWEVAQALVENGGPEALARLERSLPSLGFEPIRQTMLRRRMIERLGALSGEGAEEALAGYLLSEEEALRGAALGELGARARRPEALARRILSAIETMLREAARPASPPPAEPAALRRAACARARNGLLSLKTLAAAVASPPASPSAGAPGPIAPLPAGAREVLGVEDLPQMIRIARLLEPEADRDSAAALALAEARTLLWECAGESRRPEAFRALLYLASPRMLRSTGPWSEGRTSWVPSLRPTGSPPPPSPKVPAPPAPTAPPAVVVEAPFLREARATLRLRSPTAWGVELSAEERALWDEIRREGAP